MKNIIKFLMPLILILTLAGCKNQESAETETSVTAETTEPEADHSLVRNFTVNEIFGNLYAEGINFTFPLESGDFAEGGSLAECTLDGETIIFPDRAYMTVSFYSDGENEIVFSMLRAEYGSAPQDFSAYGIEFGMTLSDIQTNYGMPDTVYGDPKNDFGTFIYNGAGTQEFCIEFTSGIITAMEFVK